MHLPKYKPHKSSGIFLYTLHLPIILLLVLVSVMSTTLSANVTNYLLNNSDTSNGNVLGDDNEDDNDKEDEEDDKDDKDEDEDKSGSNNDDDNDEDKDDDKDEDKDDDNKSSNNRSGSLVKNDDDENEIENEVEDEDDEKDEGEDEQVIVNADGTTTRVKREEEDGELKLEIITYDVNGNKIRVEKYESKEGEEKSRVKVYDASGTKLSDFRLETEDGKELELRLKEGETELSRVKFDVEKGELLVRTEDGTTVDDAVSGVDDSLESRLRIRLEGENFVLTRRGINALSNFPLSVDDSTGVIYVKTPSGDVELKAMPDTIVQTAQASDDLDDVASVELIEGSSTSGTAVAPLEYKLTGTKSEKLLGLFNLQIPSVLIFDAATGGFLKDENSFVTKVLDLFSF